MKKYELIFAISDKPEEYAGLCAAAAKLAKGTALIYAGKRETAAAAETAYYLGEINDKIRFANYADSILSLVESKKPELIIFGSSTNCSLTAGLLGAKLGCTVITDISELYADDSTCFAKRMVYGGAAVRSYRFTSEPGIVCFSSGAIEPVETTPAGNIVNFDSSNSSANRVECVAVKQKTVTQASLTTAKKVVAVGTGIEDEEGLELAKKLAAAIDAELGCTRPVAETMKLMPRGAYIGISGQMIKPPLYIAIGVSGQVQHVVGCCKSGLVVVINKDEKAAFFSECDYGLVADFKTVLPQIISKL